MSVETHRSSSDEQHPPAEQDQVVYLDGISWEMYEGLLEARGDASVPRMTFLDGTLELMSPGFPHEESKKNLARLVERWAEEKGIFLHGVGSWTVRKKKKKGGAEPDECYFVDQRELKRQKRPDIAIEVAYSSGGLDKLEVWRRLDVPEVWVLRKDQLQFFILDRKGGAYRERARSGLLPDLEPQLLAECMLAPTQPDAIGLLLQRMRR